MLTVQIKKKLPDFILNVEFTVGREVLVLFGPSGSGKTTILRCIAGLANPDEGRVALDERTYYSSRDRIRISPQDRQIGYMFQEFALFPHMSVRKNIWYGVKETNEQATLLYQRLLEILKIESLPSRYIHGLSGGEKQRVALARALMTKPRILLLDEPMSALDYANRRELQQELKRIHDLWGIPFILVTHDPQEARNLGDHIVYLERGCQVSSCAATAAAP
ncbi:abc transporter [Lucifera butyrica]|uniref:Abc transporter n=1 Tax=Lucifera butyrica TaxID=1351585 RepID=A0A498R9J4_9FIRM|nr:ATP-binding cassette domain-containing protein [Lucifera butyrica]VBB07665.1 abc transporter [Lucifera butyrica]